ncbi:hypothetical protein [Microvirga sp. BSC39]|uniref:hypothetical protein n=1 Tax=Microvirga sp. BSC39 TaxID=1549810 RepID=UPI00068D9C14|nr:hypothetical protein [Microvirga sp. BSC39]
MVSNEIDILGYAASALTLATFAQRAMLPMRILAIGANVCFIGYGMMGLFMPVLILHLVLLPINVVRLHALVAVSRSDEDRQVAKLTDKTGMA